MSFSGQWSDLYAVDGLRIGMLSEWLHRCSGQCELVLRTVKWSVVIDVINITDAISNFLFTVRSLASY